MKRLVAFLLALVATATIADTVFTYQCTDGTKVSLTSTVTPPSSPSPPVVTPPVTRPTVNWGYYNGTLYWGGDFTLQGTKVDYADKTGSPLTGTKDILFTSNISWGIYLPHYGTPASGWVIDNVGYKSLTIALKPSIDNQRWDIYAIKAGDTDPGCHLDISAYGPVPQKGVWATYTIPLNKLCVGSDKQLYKFGLQDQTTSSSNHWWIDNMGLTY